MGKVLSGHTTELSIGKRKKHMISTRPRADECILEGKGTSYINGAVLLAPMGSNHVFFSLLIVSIGRLSVFLPCNDILIKGFGRSGVKQGKTLSR